MLGCSDVTLGDYTAEARRTRSKEFLIRNYSELCELCASVVNTPSQETHLSHYFLVDRRFPSNPMTVLLPVKSEIRCRFAQWDSSCFSTALRALGLSFFIAARGIL